MPPDNFSKEFVESELEYLAEIGVIDKNDDKPTPVISPIRQFPAQSERVETGPIRFGDDWPGVFIRGDNAFYFGMILRSYMEGDRSPINEAVLKGLVANLSSCDLHHTKNKK